MLINRQDKLRVFCHQLRQAWETHDAPLALDTEFISERRYYAQLCLVQVCAQSPDGNERDRLEAIIDPFEVDLAPLLELIEDPEVLKIVHAGGQDLQIFAQQFDCSPRHVFDTQIAAAFLGYGHQIGYVDIVRRIVGVQLSKGSQFSDWAARPLSPQQQEYALNDVRHLVPIYAALQSELEKHGRHQWAEAEFRRAEERARQVMPPEELYRRFNTKGLGRRHLGILRELAIVREELARAENKPPSTIVQDPPLLQMAKQPPADMDELRSVRGATNLRPAHAKRLMQAIESAQKLTNHELPFVASGEKPPPQFESVMGLLSVVASLRAEEHNVSRSYLASREQLAELAMWWLSGDKEVPDTPLLSDWRRALLGEELLQLLRGELALKLEANGKAPTVQVVTV